MSQAQTEVARVRCAPAVRFRHPVHFVCRGAERWRPLFAGSALPTEEDFVPLFSDNKGNEIWVLQAYCELSRRGHPVSISDTLLPDTICVLHYDDLAIKEWPARSFIVGIRADRPAMPLAHVCIEQNPAAVRSTRDVFMPHWPQPGLVPRDPARGSRVMRVAYMGIDYNLRPAFRDPAFASALRRLGVDFRMESRNFSDYHDIDLVLASRPGTRYDIDLKPASKLVNAWTAGCPALLGPESAFQNLRKSPADYIEVEEPKDALAAVQRFLKDPDLFDTMVRNGHERARAFTREAIAQRWETLLADTVMDQFGAWLQRRPLGGLRKNLRFASRSAAHWIARPIHRWRI